MPNNDYILRSDVLSAIAKWERERKSESDLIMAIATIMKCVINEVPAAVEPKRNKGHWVPVFFEDDFDGYVHNDLDDPAYYQCNQCGFERKSPTMFCQQCGALMFPEEDNDE